MKELLTIRSTIAISESIHIDAILDHDGAIERQTTLGQRARDRLRDRDHSTHAAQRQGVQTIEGEQHVTSDDCSGSGARGGVCREGIIAGHVGVNDLDLMAANKVCQLARARYVQRVAQRQLDDRFQPEAFEFSDQCGSGPHRSADLMIRGDQTVRQIDQMPLTAAESFC